MHFCGLQALSACTLLFLVIAGTTNGFECSPGCDPNNGFCEKPGECRCRPGWQGAACNQCVPFPGCLRGSCEKAWQCVCEEGWAGSQCDVDTHACSSKPCSSNSTCTETGDGGYLCVCARGYTGDQCHLRTGPCLTNGSPCQNGGTCADGDELAAHPSCLCPPGFTGDFCETHVVDCASSPCANGGGCAGRGCVCPPGVTGPACAHALPPCVGLRCARRGARPREEGRHAHAPHRPKGGAQEEARALGPLVTRSQVICFAVLGLLTCLVVLGTTAIVFFSRCEAWLANAKYTQLVRQRRDDLLRASDGEDFSVNIILPKKTKLSSYGNHYASI